MVYCCLKHRNLYKSTPNNLASLASSSSSSFNTTNNTNYHTNTTTTVTSNNNNNNSSTLSLNGNTSFGLNCKIEYNTNNPSHHNHNHHHRHSSASYYLNNTSSSISNIVDSSSLSQPNSSNSSSNNNNNTKTDATNQQSILKPNLSNSNLSKITDNITSYFTSTSTSSYCSSCANIDSLLLISYPSPQKHLTTRNSSAVEAESLSAAASNTNTSANLSSSAFVSSKLISTIVGESSSTQQFQTRSKGLSIKIPSAKPTLNESKQQLSIDSKMKAKSLMERRGSNNSLTITINPVKNKSISSPSKECSTIEYLSKASRLLTINELVDISKDNLNLYNEYYYIPTNHAELTVPGSSIKNRYKTIVPNESSRVKLPVRNNEILSSYINANYITGYKNESKAFIASQGPMSNTINDFWQMVWQEKVSCIVMITKLKERNKSKCELYMPEECDHTVDYENINVTIRQISYYPDYEVRKLLVKQKNVTRIVYHYWYLAWPDHNVPEDPNSLIQLIKQVEKFRSNNFNINNIKYHSHNKSVVNTSSTTLNNINDDLSNLNVNDDSSSGCLNKNKHDNHLSSGIHSTLTEASNNNNMIISSETETDAVEGAVCDNGGGAVLVHCSAGIGRTGCFLALAIGIKQIDNENLVDIVQIVCRLRRDRGGMIQTLEQYEFIYQVLAYYCIYYKKFPINSTTSSSSSAESPSPPPSMCLPSNSNSSSSPSFIFNINAQTIQ